MLHTLGKIKLSSSGYPADVDTADAAATQNYVERLREETGFDLSPEDIADQPCIRSTCKLSLNALVGKHGQSNQRSRRDVLCTVEQLALLQTDSSREIQSYTILSDRAVMVTSEGKKDQIPPYRHGSLPIAIFVNASARVFLLQSILRLEANGYMVLYR